MVWKSLSHANIVPLLGTVSNIYQSTGVVSAWIDDRNLHTVLSGDDLAIAQRVQLVSIISYIYQYLNIDVALYRLVMLQRGWLILSIFHYIV